MANIELPPRIENCLSGRQALFAVKVPRTHPLWSSLLVLLFAIFWNLFVVLIVASLDFPKDVISLSITNDITSDLLFSVVFAVIFAIIGVLLLLYAIKSLLEQGGYYIATPRELVFCSARRHHSIPWGQFTGEIRVSQKRGGDGDIELTLKSGSDLRHVGFVPDKIYLLDIPDVAEIAKVLRAQIQSA